MFLATESHTHALHVSRQAFSLVPADFAHSTQAAPGREKHMALYVDSQYIHHQAGSTATRPLPHRLIARRSGKAARSWTASCACMTSSRRDARPKPSGARSRSSTTCCSKSAPG
ncbi:hypothetical protein QNM99_13370 [Pseudomonas sp. PCH446]